MDELNLRTNYTLAELGHACSYTFDGVTTRYSFELCEDCGVWSIWVEARGPRGALLRHGYIASCVCTLENL